MSVNISSLFSADVQVVVNRESFQDLYLVLKDRHRHLDSRVKKPSKLEDVKRHVWKVRFDLTVLPECSQ